MPLLYICNLWNDSCAQLVIKMSNSFQLLIRVFFLNRFFGQNVGGNLYPLLIWSPPPLLKKCTEKQHCVSILTRCNKRVQISSRNILLRRFLISLRCVLPRNICSLLFSHQYDNVVYPCFSEPMHHGINCQGIKKLVLFLSMWRKFWEKLLFSHLMFTFNKYLQLLDVWWLWSTGPWKQKMGCLDNHTWKVLSLYSLMLSVSPDTTERLLQQWFVSAWTTIWCVGKYLMCTVLPTAK